MNWRHYSLIISLLIPLLSAQGQEATTLQVGEDPLDRVTSYTLLIGEDGKLKDGFYPMGFVHGQTHMTVQEGYNSRQSTSRGNGVYYGRSFNAPTVMEDPFGLRYYSLGWGADSLSGSSLFDPKKKDALPEAMNAEGKPNGKRSRLNLFDAKTVELLKTYAREHVKTWSSHIPGFATGTIIHQWGLDNEWEGTPDYSPLARAAFAEWLKRAYSNDISALNKAWKTTYPDFAGASAGKLPTQKDYKENTGMFLDWWNFQSENFVTVLARLAKEMHDTDPLKRGVVHKSTQQTIEMSPANRARTFDHEKFADLMRPYSGGLYGTDMYGTGDRQAYELNYMYNCIRPGDRSAGYGVMLCENNNHGGPGHAFAATNWRLLPNGLKASDFFTTGFAGAKDDWDKFGFLSPVDGKPKAKMFYAARWAHMVHRSEKFWTDSIPSEGIPRVAMLMPRRDVLVADPSSRRVSRWAYPEDHRWLVYRWLRERGYWVEVIPYTKLTPEYLRSYDGLFLIGADHLTEKECDVVSKYVDAGGVLVADSRAGVFDEHHAVKNQLDSLLGVKIPATGKENGVKITCEGKNILGKGEVPAEATSATVIVTSDDGKPTVFLNKHGKGKTAYINFLLGSLINVIPGQAADAFLVDGPTADSEEYGSNPEEYVIGYWLDGILGQAGLKPSYRRVATDNGSMMFLRVEEPVVDAKGNMAVVVTTRADSKERKLAAQTIELTLPGHTWERAWWGAAEDDGLQEIKISRVNGSLYKVEIPEFSTAGVIYLFDNHPPLLGIKKIQSESTSVDGHAAKVKPGVPFKVVVQLVNTTGKELEAGVVRLQAVAGWKVAPPQQSTEAVAIGKTKEFTFEVTPVADSADIKPDWLYPLVTHWSVGGKDVSIGMANIEADLDMDKVLLVLSDNGTYVNTYPYIKKTGATYSYQSPEAALIADPTVKSKGKVGGNALLEGFTAKTGVRGISPEGGAKYQSKTVDIVFDLKAEQNVKRLVVMLNSLAVPPVKMAWSTSTDGEKYTPQGTLPLNPTRYEYRTPLFDAKARYVRLQVEWADVGGSLRDVEIWGR